MQPDDKIGGGRSLAPSSIELYEALFGHPHNCLDHIAETPMLVILQPNDIRLRGEDWQCAAGKHLRRLQLLTAETDDQRRPPKVWVQAKVSKCPNGNLRTGSVDSNATTVKMRNSNDIVHIRVLWQKLRFDLLYRVFNGRRDALHSSADAKNIFGPNRTVVVHVPFKRVSLK